MNQDYKIWRDEKRRAFEQQYSDWLNHPNRRLLREPSQPDWSIQAFIEHYLKERKHLEH